MHGGGRRRGKRPLRFFFKPRSPLTNRRHPHTPKSTTTQINAQVKRFLKEMAQPLDAQALQTILLDEAKIAEMGLALVRTTCGLVFGLSSYVRRFGVSP